MKKLILAIILIAGVWSAQALEKFIKVEKWTEHTYEQGLSISIDIAECLLADKGIILLHKEMFYKFQMETDWGDVSMMWLVMEISKEYNIGMTDRYISPSGQKYIKTTIKKCADIAEEKANIKPQVRYSVNDNSMTTIHPNASFWRKTCSKVTDPEEIKACSKPEASSED